MPVTLYHCYGTALFPITLRLLIVYAFRVLTRLGDSLMGVASAVGHMLFTSCSALMVGLSSPSTPPGTAVPRGSHFGPWVVKCSTSSCPHCAPGAPWRGEPRAGCSSVGGGGGSVVGDSSSSSNSSSSTERPAHGACPARRLASNLSSALLQLLPPLARTAYWAAEHGLEAWAADTAGTLLYMLTLPLFRLHAEADRRKHQPQQPKQAQAGRQRPTGSGRSGREPGAEADDAPAASHGQEPVPVPQPANWRDLLDDVEPIRLLKLQLRHPAEPLHVLTSEVLLLLAFTHAEELGEAVRQDGELCDLLVARVQAAGPHLRDSLQPLVLFLEPVQGAGGAVRQVGAEEVAAVGAGTGARGVRPRDEAARAHAGGR